MSQPPNQAVSQSSRAPSAKRRFTESFKRDSVRLVTHEQYSFEAAASAVGVSGNSLRHWHKKYAPQAQPCGEDATTEQLQAENNRLRNQLKKAEMERDILKKANFRGRHTLRTKTREIQLDQGTSNHVANQNNVRSVERFNIGLLRLPGAKDQSPCHAA
jgi:transposase